MIYKCAILTVGHFAALELLNAIKFIADTPVEPNHVKVRVASTPSLFVEGQGDVCVVALSPVGWVSLGLATLSFLDVVKPLIDAGLEESAEVVAGRAGRPSVIPVAIIN